ncbi:MAG: amidohydrolase family protein, partial [Gammaproteobacteria bacterium]|nr:amidohydrolase family protein [Gammaproteobacteria bacterium]
MSLNKKVFIGLLSLLISSFSLSEELLLKNAKIHTATDRGTIEKADILITDGVIVRIGKNIVSSRAVVEDLSGKVISPGLIAPQTQLGIVEIELIPETRDDRSDIYSAGLSIDSAFNPSSTLIPYNLTGGVTLSLTSPSSSGLFSGLTSAFSLSGSLDESLIHSNIALSANISGGEDSMAAKVQLLRDSLSLSALIGSKKYLEIHRESFLPDGVNYSTRDLLSLKRVVDKEIPLVVTANRASDILTLIDFAKTNNINLIINGAEEGWRVSKQLSEARVPVILQPIDNIPNSFNELGSRLDNASLLHNSGVKILIGSHETHNAYLSRQGAGIAVSYGLPWEEALKGLTKNIAEVFKINKRGSIQPGYIADIVIWNGDPLEVTSFVEEVYLSGKSIPTRNRAMRLK